MVWRVKAYRCGRIGHSLSMARHLIQGYLGHKKQCPPGPCNRKMPRALYGLWGTPVWGVGFGQRVALQLTIQGGGLRV